MTSDTSSPSSSFFNDLTQAAPVRETTQDSTSDCQKDSTCDLANEGQPRAKRIACVLCRKRKLRCDGARPKCGTCSRLAHECGYDEVRKKSGPKRGYVKLLEQRLQQVETMLKTGGPSDNAPMENPVAQQQNQAPVKTTNQSETRNIHTRSDNSVLPGFAPRPSTNNASNTSEKFSWEMIGLGLEEPLPTQEAIDDLHRIYFDKLHPAVPMIHRPRYLAAMNLVPNMRPPVCLRYIIWTLAASVSDKYYTVAPEFYRRARKYAEADELKGNGEAMLTVAHCQTWILITWYEFKNMFFPRAWQSTGRAISLASMLGLNRLDGAALDVKQCLPPPKDWTEREERRRTFWMAFSADRYSSIGTGWPHRLDERDIMTLLPTDDEAFLKSSPKSAPSLEQAFANAAAFDVSAPSGVILITCLLGRNLTHLHRPSPADNEEDLNGEFWQRHRQLESILDNIALAMPDDLRVPNGLPDTNVIFMNMLIHTSVICLHQAAIFKADRNHLSQQIINESRARCLTGAAEITRIMKMSSHVDLSTLNPFSSFCLYVAARVFVQYLKWKPKDQNMVSSLQFLGSAMQALSKKNPLTESFIAQLEVDLEGTGIVIASRASMWNHTGLGDEPAKGAWRPAIIQDGTTLRRAPAEIPVNTDAIKCSPLFEIRDTQANGQDTSSIFHRQQTFNYNSAINIEMDSAFSNTTNALQYQIPSRSKDTPFTSQMSLMDHLNGNIASEMDFSRSSESRSASYKDSSSTSFTPPSMNDSSEQPYPAPMEKNRSPGVQSLNDSATAPSSMPTPGGSNQVDTMFFEMPDSSFHNFNSNLFAPFGTSDMSTNGNTGTSGVMHSSNPNASGGGWDIGNLGDGNTTTGLTPLTGDSWSETMDPTGNFMHVHGGHGG